MMSVDGVGAFDLISRSAMLTGLRDAPGCDSALPFVLQFYGRPSKHIWEDEQGEVHEVFQGEGGEQGDPLMPALFALGQHSFGGHPEPSVADREVVGFLGRSVRGRRASPHCRNPLSS